MRIVILAAALAALATPALAQQSNYVDGYFRSDGTYVAPHFRSNPDSTPNNNYGTRPNYNPYTGQQGTREPSYGYTQQPSYNQPRQPSYGSSYGNSYGTQQRQRPQNNGYVGF